MSTHTFVLFLQDAETAAEFKEEMTTPLGPKWLMQRGKRRTVEVTVNGDTEIVYFKMRWADEIEAGKKELEREPTLYEQLFQMFEEELSAKLKASILQELLKPLPPQSQFSAPPSRQDRKEWWNRR